MPEDKKEVEPVITDKTWERIEKQRQQGKPPTMTSANLDDLLAANGVEGIKALDGAPPAQPKQTAAEAPVDGSYLGAFRAGDGRYLHKYQDSQSRDGYMILPKKLEEMTDEDFYGMSLSIAEVSQNRIPQNLTVKFKDPQWAGYWFNRKASDGKSVSRGLALGFTPAKREDCEWVMPGLNDADGAVTDGDLVLMKIHKMKYFRQFVGAYYEEAKLKGSQKSYKHAAENMTGGGNNKVSHYMTPQANEFHGLGPVTHIPTVS